MPSDSLPQATRSTTETARRPRKVVELPAPLEKIAVGASGKYLAAALKGKRQVAVIDVAAAKIATTIPVQSDEVLVAAGASKLVILEQETGKIAQYELGTWKRNLYLDCPPYTLLAMGASSEGPLVARKSEKKTSIPVVLSIDTLRETDFPISGVCTELHDAKVSGNGKILSLHCDGRQHAFEFDGQAIYKFSTREGSSGAMTPSADGEALYTNSTIETPNYSLSTKPEEFKFSCTKTIPSITGPFYLGLTFPGLASGVARRPWNESSRPSPLTFHIQGTKAALFAIDDTELPDTPIIIGPRQIFDLQLNEHIFLSPEADALITIPSSRTRITIHRFNLLDEIKSNGNKGLLVISSPPGFFERGREWSYPLRVFSTNSDVTFSLEEKPEGMKISSQGLLTWVPTPNFEPKFVSTKVIVRNGTGETISYSFAIRDRNGPRSSPESNWGLAKWGLCTRSAYPIASEPEATIKLQRVSPRSGERDAWQIDSSHAAIVKNPTGTLVGLQVSDHLIRVDRDGRPTADVTELPLDYQWMGVRGDTIVGLAASPARLEILDHLGKLQKSIPLGDGVPTALALHPIENIAYVCLTRTTKLSESKLFVVVDERTAEVFSASELVGDSIAVDPHGKFLLASYSRILSPSFTAAQFQDSLNYFIHRLPPLGEKPSWPDYAVPGKFRTDTVALSLHYDISMPLKPRALRQQPLFATISGGSHRLVVSPDASHYFALWPGFEHLEFNLRDLQEKPRICKSKLPTHRWSDLVIHSVMPLKVIVALREMECVQMGNEKPFFNGDAISNMWAPTTSDAVDVRGAISANGRSLLVLTNRTLIGGPNKGYNWGRLPLPFTSFELRIIDEALAQDQK